MSPPGRRVTASHTGGTCREGCSVFTVYRGPGGPIQPPQPQPAGVAVGRPPVYKPEPIETREPSGPRFRSAM